MQKIPHLAPRLPAWVHLSKALARRAKRTTKPMLGWHTAIYALCDQAGCVRYVGKTTLWPLERRLDWHRRQPVNSDVRAWLASDPDVTIQLLTFCPNDDWERWERLWIAWFLRLGRLYNRDPGGVVRDERGRPTPEGEVLIQQKERLDEARERRWKKRKAVIIEREIERLSKDLPCMEHLVKWSPEEAERILGCRKAIRDAFGVTEPPESPLPPVQIPGRRKPAPPKRPKHTLPPKSAIHPILRKKTS